MGFETCGPSEAIVISGTSPWLCLFLHDQLLGRHGPHAPEAHLGRPRLGLAVRAEGSAVSDARGSAASWNTDDFVA